MGLRTNAIATIWEIEDKGKYAKCQFSISKKNKQTNKYETDYAGFANFVGDAYTEVKNYTLDERPRVKITDFEVTNSYSKERKQTYTNVAVFKCEIQNKAQDSNASSSDGFMDIPDGNDEDLPFA